MTAVVEAGPVTVRGPRRVDDERGRAAVASVDDELTLLDDMPLPVDDLWYEVLRAAVDPAAHAVAVLHPTWWPPPRIERVRTAAQRCCADVHTVTRADAIRAMTGVGDPVVVEIDVDVVVVTAGDGIRGVPRVGDGDRIARAVVAATAGADAVVVDAPPDVAGAADLATTIGHAVRSAGATVVAVEPRSVRRAAADLCAPAEPTPAAVIRPRRPVAAVVGGVALSLAGFGLAVGRSDQPVDPAGPEPETLLVEGRVAVTVPARWAVRRVTGGPGSARVEVTAPARDAALLLTQSPVPAGTAFDDATDALRTALADEPPGVFTDPVVDDRTGGRRVVAYREIRSGRHVDWAVFVDGPVRIAVGCRGSADPDPALQRACDRAVTSAHAVFG